MPRTARWQPGRRSRLWTSPTTNSDVATFVGNLDRLVRLSRGPLSGAGGTSLHARPSLRLGIGGWIWSPPGHGFPLRRSRGSVDRDTPSRNGLVGSKAGPHRTNTVAKTR